MSHMVTKDYTCHKMAMFQQLKKVILFLKGQGQLIDLRGLR